jgi:hypothetical protein
MRSTTQPRLAFVHRVGKIQRHERQAIATVVAPVMAITTHPTTHCGFAACGSVVAEHFAASTHPVTSGT